MEKIASYVDDAKGTSRIAIFLLLFVIWKIIATPQYRFPIVDQISLERLILFGAVFAIITTGRLFSRHSKITPLLLAFFISEVISHYLSPYRDIPTSLQWIEISWKAVFFYFVVLFTLKDKRDLSLLFIGITVISLLYQFHSWIDFFNGGNFLYQQGIKRMTGVWSSHHLGTANAWGFITLYTLPFGMYWYQTTTNNLIKMLMLFYFAMSVASIIASGTRAALVVLVAIAALHYRKQIAKISLKFMIPAIIVLIISFQIIPDEYKHRYFDLIAFGDDVAENRNDEIAIKSANSRIQGLVDGWNLFLKRPVFGYGPGTSAAARAEVNQYYFDSGRLLQLHNFIGQILSETGLVGTTLFSLLLLTYFRGLAKARQQYHELFEHNKEFIFMCQTLIYMVFIKLLYGLFSHNLHSAYWGLAFGAQSAFLYILSQEHKAFKKPS